MDGKKQKSSKFIRSFFSAIFPLSESLGNTNKSFESISIVRKVRKISKIGSSPSAQNSYCRKQGLSFFGSSKTPKCQGGSPAECAKEHRIVPCKPRCQGKFRQCANWAHCKGKAQSHFSSDFLGGFDFLRCACSSGTPVSDKDCVG